MAVWNQNKTRPFACNSPHIAYVMSAEVENRFCEGSSDIFN